MWWAEQRCQGVPAEPPLRTPQPPFPPVGRARLVAQKNGKESACSPGGQGSIAGLGRSPGEGHENPLQYCCLEKPMDRGAWWATVQGVTQSQARLSD